jgi:hypothetical protein
MMIALLFKLLIGHALADFVLQTDCMTKSKSWHSKPPGPNGQKTVPCWFYWMGAHGLIHGGVVWYVTGSMALGALEVVLHCAIDALKCANRTNPHVDQALHLVCRIGYVVL